MTLFEYLAIAFSLLYSVAALRLLGGIPAAVDASRRYWVHLAMCFLVLLGVAASFWAFWSLREVVWTFPRFLLALFIPGLVYYCAAALIPENPEAVGSWRDHYFEVRGRFFTGFALFGVAAATSASVNLGMGLIHPARVVHVGAIVMGVVGSRSGSHRVHAGLVLLIALLSVAWGVTAGLRPGPLAR